MRVKPGDAANSYLYMKITGDARIIGAQMPLTGGALSAAEIAAIRDWINGGASSSSSMTASLGGAGVD